VPRTRSLFPVALSVQASADALKIPRRVIADAIKSAELVAYAGSGRRVRILVPDLIEWVRTTWPRASIKRRVPNG